MMKVYIIYLFIYLLLLLYIIQYIGTFPNLIVKGVFTGPLRMEFNGKTTLSCDSTGFDAVIDWKPSVLYYLYCY